MIQVLLNSRAMKTRNMLWLKFQNITDIIARQKNDEVNWSGFSKKTYPERLKTLRDSDLLSHELQENLEKNETLSVAIADQLSENVVGTFSLPFSIVPEVVVNNQAYTVPYVTEEPSVVAAAYVLL